VHSIKKNAAFSLAAQLTGAAFTAVLMVFLAHRLRASGFGVLTLALGIAAMAQTPADFGIANSVARFVAERRGDRRRVASVVADGLRLKLLSGAAACVLLFALAPVFADAYRLPVLAWPIRGAALYVFGNNVFVLGSVFVASARADLLWRTALAESAVETAATIALVLAGGGAAAAAFGTAIGYLAGGGLTLALLIRLVGPGSLPRGLRFGPEARRIAAYGSVLLLIDGAYMVFLQVDVLVIAANLPARAVGVFSGPMRLIAFLSYPGGALATAVAPRLARTRELPPNVDAFVRALRLLVVIQAVICTFAYAWAPLVMRLALGSSYHGSAGALRALIPYVFLAGFGSLVSVGANYLGEARKRIPVAIAAALVNLGLDLVLVPRIGVIGACAGTDVAFALYAFAHLGICARALHARLAPLLATAARTTLCAAAAVAILLLCGDALDRLWLMAVGGLSALACFALVLTLTGELTRSQLRDALAAVPFLGGRLVAAR
jgi:O-antigen/teichoic acid export membrane protein